MINKSTIITGAAGFLGHYHCSSLLEMNKSIIILDINKKKLVKLKKILTKKFKGKKIYDFKIDITKEAQIKKLKNLLKKKKIKKKNINLIQKLKKNETDRLLKKKLFTQKKYIIYFLNSTTSHTVKQQNDS